MYKAHINKVTNQVQSVEEHSKNTALLCQSFAVDKLKPLMYAIGLLHDVGKYQLNFQRRIDGANIRVEHSVCGAKAAAEKYQNPICALMQYCIAGHHSGLPNSGAKNDTPDKSTLYGRLQRKCEDFSFYRDELKLPDLDARDFAKYLLEDCCGDNNVLTDKFAFFVRYCFSCLVDADSIDTMNFCNSGETKPMNSDFAECLKKINAKLDAFECKTQLQKARSSLQKQVFDKISVDSEIYLMNMPTGSGKTLCSMKFALERALRNNKKRIIYIIPYNSIIDQTYEVFENIFGSDAQILRHQSTFSYENDEDFDEDYAQSALYSAENWDASIIMTTSVQFFESIYSNKRGKLRKLHNISDSIIIFDEAHLMPVDYLKPCLEAVSYITKYLSSEALFLTATMPDFSELIKRYALTSSIVTELIEDKTDFVKFNKCSFENLGVQSEESLLTESGKFPASLIIVNKRADAKKLYDMYPGEKYHLSTYMSGYDRKRVIKKIRERLSILKNEFDNFRNVPSERKITLVSTSLIEAGVDLDFYAVFRELTGLDSILQSAGRCNREGERTGAKTFIFSFEHIYGKFSIDERANLTKGIIERFDDISAPLSIDSYYKSLFFIQDERATKNSICNFPNCKKYDSLPFKDYSEHFEIIPSNTVSIAVASDEKSSSLIKALAAGEKIDGRKIQLYTFSVYKYEFDKLYAQHILDDYSSGIWCLTNSDYYDENTGISFESKDYIL